MIQTSKRDTRNTMAGLLLISAAFLLGVLLGMLLQELRHE